MLLEILSMIKFFDNVLKFLFGLIIISIIIWNRLLRERVPQIFVAIENKTFMFHLSLFFCFLFLFLIILEIYKLLNSSQEVTKNKVLLWCLDKWTIYIINGPIFVYEKITNNVNLQPVIELPASYFTAYFNYPKLFVIIFYYTPQIIISTIFVIETCVYHQRVYFYKSLYLILFMLIVKVIIFIFKHYSERRLNHFNLFLDIRKTEDGVDISLKAPEHIPKDISFETVVNQYGVFCDYWFIYTSIKIFMDEIYAFNKLYASYIRLYSFSCFLIGWLFLFLLIL
jgi:hypothetical protein